MAPVINRLTDGRTITGMITKQGQKKDQTKLNFAAVPRAAQPQPPAALGGPPQQPAATAASIDEQNVIGDDSSEDEDNRPLKNRPASKKAVVIDSDDDLDEDDRPLRRRSAPAEDDSDDEDEEPITRLRTRRKPVALPVVDHESDSTGDEPAAKKRIIDRPTNVSDDEKEELREQNAGDDNEGEDNAVAANRATARSGGRSRQADLLLLDAADLGDNPLELTGVVPQPEQYHAVEYAQDWQPADFAALAQYAARGLWQWTFHVTGLVDKMLKKYMSADKYAAEYCRRLKDKAPELYDMLDYCIVTKQPWKLSEVVARLPNALDAQVCGTDIGNYLVRLDIRNEDEQVDIAYSGSAWGLKTSVNRRARQHSSPAHRASEPQKELYKLWDYDDFEVAAHIGMMTAHPRASVARYGTLPLLLDETMDVGLFCGGWHKRSDYRIQCIPPALIEQWRDVENLRAAAPYDEVLQTAMDCRPVNVNVPLLERNHLGLGSPLMRMRLSDDRSATGYLQRVDKNMAPGSEGHGNDCVSVYITKLFDICIKPKQWRQIRDRLAFDPKKRYVQLTLEKADGYDADNLALLGPEYDNGDVPDATKIKLRMSFINKNGEEKSVFIQLTPHFENDLLVLQDRRAVIAQTMWHTVEDVKLDPESPLVYNFWTTAENQGPMLYSDEAQRLKTDLATKTQKELTKDSADRWLKQHGHRKCPNGACQWQFRSAPAAVYTHFGLFNMETLSPVNDGIPSMSRALACRQSLLPLLQEEYEGNPEKPNSERDIRAFHLAEYYEFSNQAVSFVRNKPREPVYATDITRVLGGLSKKEYAERQKQQKQAATAAKASNAVKAGPSKMKK